MERDQLIAEVARTTGVRLDRSDPILAAAVVHEALLNEALVKLDRQVTTQADRVTVASTQAVADAKKEAEALITDTGVWLEERIKAAGAAAVKNVIEELRVETKKVECARRVVERIALVGLLCGLAAISGLTGFAVAALR